MYVLVVNLKAVTRVIVARICIFGQAPSKTFGFVRALTTQHHVFGHSGQLQEQVAIVTSFMKRQT